MIINKHTSLYRKIRKLEFLINHLLNSLNTYLGYKKVKLIPKFQKWGNTLYKAQKTSTKLFIKERQTPGDKTLGGFLETFNVSISTVISIS